jgi:hypothetical protein
VGIVSRKLLAPRYLQEERRRDVLAVAVVVGGQKAITWTRETVECQPRELNVYQKSGWLELPSGGDIAART